MTLLPGCDPPEPNRHGDSRRRQFSGWGVRGVAAHVQRPFPAVRGGGPRVRGSFRERKGRRARGPRYEIPIPFLPSPTPRASQAEHLPAITRSE